MKFRSRLSKWTLCTATGKRGYKRRDVVRVAKSARRGGQSLTPYRCPECERWHLTSKGER